MISDGHMISGDSHMTDLSDVGRSDREEVDFTGEALRCLDSGNVWINEDRLNPLLPQGLYRLGNGTTIIDLSLTSDLKPYLGSRVVKFSGLSNG